MSPGKLIFGGVILIGLIVGGFILLLRGCLSKFDERSAIAPALYIEKDGKGILFSIVKNAKATSYSQKGGITQKSVSTNYHIQNNDPLTGAALGEQKIKHHSDIKSHPVETLGASAGLAWVFIGELMAFDPFSLEKKADRSIIESKNPALKGKLPDERRYYDFDPSKESISITANDGTTWLLNANSLTAAQYEKTETGKDELEQQIDSLEDRFWKTRDRQRDSIRHILNILRKQASASRHIQSTRAALQRAGSSFSRIKTNQDTVKTTWLGLYSKSEIEKLRDEVSLQTAYDETARRQLYASVYKAQENGDCKIAKEFAVTLWPEQFYLQGGFLLDKKTGLPVSLPNDNRLVVHKDKIGNEGKILLSRVDFSGKQAWTTGTGLKEWTDWIATPARLFILGADHPSLSGGECNVLLCIDLANGKMSRYDYFNKN